MLVKKDIIAQKLNNLRNSLCPVPVICINSKDQYSIPVIYIYSSLSFTVSTAGYKLC